MEVFLRSAFYFLFLVYPITMGLMLRHKKITIRQLILVSNTNKRLDTEHSRSSRAPPNREQRSNRFFTTVLAFQARSLLLRLDYYQAIKTRNEYYGYAP